MFWVNVDKPTKKCVIHKEGCKYEQNKVETLFKGINELKRDGGWFCFVSMEETQDYCKGEWELEGYITRRGGCCFS